MLIDVLGVLILVVDSSGCNASGSFNFGYFSCWAMNLSTTLTIRVSSFISDCFFPLPRPTLYAHRVGPAAGKLQRRER